MSIASRLGRAGVVIVLGAALMLFAAPSAMFVGLGGSVQAQGSDNRRAVRIDVTFTGSFVQGALASGETLPADATFGSVAFATHDGAVSYFNAGEAASAGLKAFAETGSTVLLVEEFAAQTNGANVYPTKKNGGTFPQGATAAQVFEFHRASRGEDHLTFVASLSESPDWFVGARNIELRPGGMWIEELEVDLFAWDAGTDSGPDWDSADSATDPPASVTSLKGVGKFSDTPVAKLKITMLAPPSTGTNQRVLRADANSLDGALNVFWDAYPPKFKVIRNRLHTVDFDRYLVAWKSGDEEFQTDLGGDRVKVVMGRDSTNTVLEGLTNGTEYTVRVTHANAVGAADHHSRISAATPVARERVLVSTFGRGLSHSWGLRLNVTASNRGSMFAYNRFTTGPSAASLGSVTFARLQPRFTSSSPTVPKLELHLLEDLPGGEVGDSQFSQPGQPGALVGKFVSPPEYHDGPAKFVAPGDGFALSASTDYWLKLVLVQGEVVIPMTMIGGPDPHNGLDPDSLTGWDISNACQWSNVDIWHIHRTRMCSYYSNFMVLLSGPVESTLPLASISGGSAVEGESIEFTVELSSEPSAQATVSYDTVDGRGRLSATTSGNDYTAVSGGTVTFAAGETTKTISIATGDDSIDEHDERFIVRLSSPSSNIALSELDSAAGWIINNDQTASSDSTLAGITLTDQDGNTIALNETFDPLQFVYTADAGASVDTMNLDLSFGEGIDPNYVRYFDAFGKVKEGNKSRASSAEFSRIGPGLNLLKVLVTSKDRSRESLYKVMVDKAASSDASIATLVLQDIRFNDFVLSPAFSPSVTEYTATVDHNPPFYVDVGLNHRGADAEVSVNGEVVVPYDFDMPAGDKTLAIEVTAEDGTTQTYTFTFEAQGGDVPAAPSRPTIESVAHNSVTITWNDPDDSTITGYQVLRHNPAIHNTGEFTVIEDDTGSADTSYEDTTVAPETTYVYRIKARNAHGLSEASPDSSATTPAEPTPPNQAATGRPTIAGTPQVGETLSADTSGISDANGLNNVQFNYQWIRDDGNTDTQIPGATARTYTLTRADQGKTVKASVSFTDDDGYAESLTSAATTQVSPPPNQTATGLPTIAGTPQVGETLSADTSGIGDANGLINVQFNYQWIRNDSNTDTEIVGATAQTYTLTHDDVGTAIKVQVTFTDDHGYSESVTSAATAAVSADQVETLWSGEMTVANYGNGSLGAYLDDTLFANVTGSTQLQIKWLWYLEPARKLYLAFRAPAAGTADWTLHIDDMALDFPSGDSNFVFRSVDVSWTEGQIVNVRIVR